MLSFSRGDNLVELSHVGHTSSETFAYNEIGLQAWQRRPRVMYAVPAHVLEKYMPLASKTFQNLSSHNTADESATTSNIHVIGDIGMGFALDESRIPRMSVEAAALHQLVQSEKHSSHEISVPKWMIDLEQTWTHQMSLFMFDSQTGWRGCFAEHRLWSSLILHMKIDIPNLKTPYAKPTVRGWFSAEVLNDFQECVSPELAEIVATKIAEMGYDGAPDLVLYHQGTIRFVEVKSANDKLRPHQLRMMQELSKIPNVICQICCPKTALKRFASVTLSDEVDDDETVFSTPRKKIR